MQNLLRQILKQYKKSIKVTDKMLRVIKNIEFSKAIEPCKMIENNNE